MRNIALVLVLALAGCGYFNSLYNANRRFADAERASARNDPNARLAYNESIEKAAVSYRNHPNSRWADDALLLIGRARFALGQDEEAVAALRHVLEKTPGDQMAGTAHAYLGAALVRLERLDSAVLHLDQAAHTLKPESELGAMSRLWRARASFSREHGDAAWQDLDAVLGVGGRRAVDVALEYAARAVEYGDSARFAAGLARLSSLRQAGRAVEPLQDILTRASQRWSPAEVFDLGAPLERTSWSGDATDRLTLFRARLAVEAGDTATGIALGTRVAEHVRGGIGSAARLMVGQLRLALLDDPAELEDVRAFLLPAFDEPSAFALQRSIRAARILIDRGDSPATALSLFAAAEFARDELNAPRLARRLFLEFASLANQTPWSGKALLAAAVIDTGNDTDDALVASHGNVYVRAARGEFSGDDLSLAEQRLARGLAGLRADAVAEAVTRDVVVGRALAVLDSTRLAARNDSMRIVCGTLIDSLQIAGIRADSTRSACVRGDSTRVAFVLRADTSVLLDTTLVRRSGSDRARPVIRPDTGSARMP